MRLRLVVLIPALALLSLAACDSGGGDGTTDPTGPGAGADTTAAEDVAEGDTAAPEADTADPGPDTTVEPPACECAAGFTCVDGACVEDVITPPPPTCDVNGFTQKFPAFEAQQNGDWLYAVLDSTSAPFNRLQIRFKAGAVKGPGPIDLATQPPGSCDVCVTVESGCTAAGGKLNCAKTYAATAGTLDLDLFPTVPTPKALPTAPAGQLPVATKPAQASCVEEGTGTLVGDNIANFKLQNCYGDVVSLHDSCGGDAKGTWLMGIAEWCTACTQLLAGLAKEAGGDLSRESIAAKWPGVEIKFLYFEDISSRKPSLQNCMNYATKKKLDPADVLIDNGLAMHGTLRGVVLDDEAADASWCVDGVEFSGELPALIGLVKPAGYGVEMTGLATTYQNLNPYLVANNGVVNSYTPWHAVLRTSNMEYIWSSYFDSRDPFTALNQVVFGQ